MAAGATKWKILAAIALTIVVADQWTKLLAVEHLTPGLANAALADEGRRIETYEERGQVLASVGFVEKVKLFYGEVRHPCDRRGRLCPEIKSIEGFWSWRYAENTGAAWSILAGQRFVLLALSLVALFFLVQFVRKLDPGESMLLIALSLVLGGAIGNMIDRVYLGYVVDFILWYSGDFYWPTFNVADTAISTGLGLIGLNMLLEAIAKHKNSDAPNGSVAPQ
jgi:signal peptidase II